VVLSPTQMKMDMFHLLYSQLRLSFLLRDILLSINLSSTKGATSGTGIAHHFGAFEFVQTFL
jgi:hypothetical protein